MKHYDKYDNDKPFDKWLFSICVNTYKNSLRMSFNRLRYSFDSEEEKARFFNSIPLTDGIDKDDFEALHRAIIKLTKKQRIVISLFYFKDLGISEIAKILSVPEGTVKSRLSSAKKALRRSLTDEET